MRKSSGQATVEYILMLAVVVVFFITLFRGLLLPAITAAENNIANLISQVFQNANLHTLILSH